MPTLSEDQDILRDSWRFGEGKQRRYEAGPDSGLILPHRGR
jgi:hypothetical protein